MPDIEDGEYSGITWLSGNNYAVVDNDQKGGGILHFTIPIDNSGYVGEVSMRPAAGTVVSTDKNRDNEGITYVPSLGTLYVSSERHQEIREYDLAGRATGKALQIPSDLAVKAITSNRGFEALTFNNATGLFWTMTEAPLAKDTFLPRILRLQSFGTDGKPMALSDGYEMIEKDYDAAGNVTAERYFNGNSEPVLCRQGYAAVEKTYNEQKKVIRESYFGLDGKPVSIQEGYVVIERDYDAEGNVTAERYLDVSGQPVSLEKGTDADEKNNIEAKGQQDASFGPGMSLVCYWKMKSLSNRD